MTSFLNNANNLLNQPIPRHSCVNAAMVALLSRPSSLLSGDAMNGCAFLLTSLASRQFSTAALHSYLLHYHRLNPNNPLIWKLVKRTSYWEKDIWVIPVHVVKKEHWVLATVYVKQRRIDIFDSLAGTSYVQSVVEVSVRP